MPGKLQILGDDIAYADGAETELIRIIGSSSDRTVGSDDLVAQIVDWPTRYHLSSLRGHLFSPIVISPEDRVLDVGCGTGVNTRVMADRGAQVVGIEGTLDRARAAALRAEDLDFVGDVADYETDNAFDLVLLIGVLEYSTSGLSKLVGPHELLEHCRKFLKPDGVLILAIENQIGLKYLLSYPEDHLGIPWIGLEGYGVGTPRTWTRRKLQKLLHDSGFTESEFLCPWPDYKLPTVIYRESLLLEEGGDSIVKNFVRQPVLDYSGSPMFNADPLRALSVMIDAGLGAEVSNSFLVVASSSRDSVVSRIDDSWLWMSSGERKSRYRRRRKLDRDANGWKLLHHNLQGSNNLIIDQSENRSEVWLRHTPAKVECVVNGTNFEDELLQAVAVRDEECLTRLLHEYLAFLDSHQESATRSEGLLKSPFSPLEGEIGIIGTMIDCTPANLVRAIDGTLTSVDTEWACSAACSKDLLVIRGLLQLCFRINQSGFGPIVENGAETITELVKSLLSRVDLEYEMAILMRAMKAEWELQTEVSPIAVGDFDDYISMSWGAPVETFARRSISDVLTENSVLRQEYSQVDQLRADRDRLLNDLRLVGEDRELVIADRERIVASETSIRADRDRLLNDLRLVGEDRERVIADRDRIKESEKRLQQILDSQPSITENRRDLLE